MSRAKIEQNSSGTFGDSSKGLARHAEEIASGPAGLALDVGCGFGRNAMALVQMGVSVVAADRDIRRLQILAEQSKGHFGLLRGDQSLSIMCADLSNDQWPIKENSLSGIACIHFPSLGPIGIFHRYLQMAGWLYFETFGVQGENYRQLPHRGEVRGMLEENFAILDYNERPVGPPVAEAAVVNLFARRL